MSHAELWNSRGLILGPEEAEEAFFKRCKSAPFTFPETSVSLLAKKLYDINPDWVDVQYSDKGLYFWEGGCTWIEEAKVIIQLKASFNKKNKILGLYTKDELLAHELVHAVRHTFEEPIFEEILAYQTAKSPFRRFFGPLFRTSRETTFSLLAFLFLIFASLFTPFHKTSFACLFSLAGFGLFRLCRFQKIFQATRKKLAKITKEEKALPIMIRLEDKEIMRFAKMSEEEIMQYAAKMQKIQFRWQQIYKAYFV